MLVLGILVVLKCHPSAVVGVNNISLVGKYASFTNAALKHGLSLRQACDYWQDQPHNAMLGWRIGWVLDQQPKRRVTLSYLVANTNKHCFSKE